MSYRPPRARERLSNGLAADLVQDMARLLAGEARVRSPALGVT